MDFQGRATLAGLLALVVALGAPCPVPAAQTFAPTGNLISARNSAVAAPLPDGRVLVAGGTQSGESIQGLVNSVEFYDPAAGEFNPPFRSHRPAPSPPRRRSPTVGS